MHMERPMFDGRFVNDGCFLSSLFLRHRDAHTHERVCVCAFLRFHFSFSIFASKSVPEVEHTQKKQVKHFGEFLIEFREWIYHRGQLRDIFFFFGIFGFRCRQPVIVPISEYIFCLPRTIRFSYNFIYRHFLGTVIASIRNAKQTENSDSCVEIQIKIRSRFVWNGRERAQNFFWSGEEHTHRTRMSLEYFEYK